MFSGSKLLTLAAALCQAQDALPDSLSLLQTQAQKQPRPVALTQRTEVQSTEALYDQFTEPEEIEGAGPRAAAPPGAVRATFDSQGEDPEGYHNLKFNKVSYRNLGGLGPHTDQPKNVRFKKVAKTFDGKQVDMILESDNYVTAKPGKTGLFGELGRINILNGNEVDFVARFVDVDDKPVSMRAFHVSFLDLDTGKEAGEEELTIGGYLKSYTLDNTELTEVKMSDGRTRFIAGEPGIGADNPTDPLMLTDLQAARTVSFLFPPGLDSFKFSYKVHKNANGSPTEGRHFLMAGMTSMYFCDTKPISMDFDLAKVAYSNLGGMGPDFNSPRALRFENVMAITNDQQIDLKIENITEYNPSNTTNNGLNGQFAQLNIGGNTVTKFKFTFLKSGEEEEVKMDWTYFSVYDLDQGKKGTMYQESVEVKGFVTHYLTESSELQLVQKGERWYDYTASTWGTAKDNPTDPMDLTDQQKDRAVTFLYHEVASFDAKFQAKKPAKAGRNFLFAGKSSVVFC